MPSQQDFPSRDALIQAMPKVELHRHLEGCVRTASLIDIARQHGISLPSYVEADLAPHVKLSAPMENLEAVLAMFTYAQQAFASYDAIARLTWEALEDAYTKENIRLLELRYSPDFMLRGKNLAWQRAHEIIAATVAEFEQKQAGRFACGLIAIASRSYGMESVKKTLDFAIANRESFIGFDFADSEAQYPSKLYVDCAKRLREAGLPLTVHSGEEGDFSLLEETVDCLAPRRIGHGVRAVSDKSGGLIAKIKAAGMTIECNPWSNYLTRAVPTVEDHPLPIFLAEGLSVAICADDPELLDTDLNKEYRLAVDAMGLRFEDLRRVNNSALLASFLPDHRKAAISREFS